MSFGRSYLILSLMRLTYIFMLTTRAFSSQQTVPIVLCPSLTRDRAFMSSILVSVVSIIFHRYQFYIFQVIEIPERGLVYKLPRNTSNLPTNSYRDYSSGQRSFPGTKIS
jgi:hypothetical protein